MIVDMGQNRSYHNKLITIHQSKSAIVKLKCKNYASKTMMAKKKKKPTEVIIARIFILPV